MIRSKHSRKKHTKLSWLWEFSKKVVATCFLLYVIHFFYTMTVMVVSGDYSNLGTFIEQSTNVLITCVFGYFVKAGAENVFKIRKSGSGQPDPDSSVADPDGEDTEEPKG